jgi:hypothetical protein
VNSSGYYFLLHLVVHLFVAADRRGLLAQFKTDMIQCAKQIGLNQDLSQLPVNGKGTIDEYAIEMGNRLWWLCRSQDIFPVWISFAQAESSFDDCRCPLPRDIKLDGMFVNISKVLYYSFH